MSVLQLTGGLARRGHQIDLLHDIGGELESEYGNLQSTVDGVEELQRKVTPAGS